MSLSEAFEKAAKQYGGWLDPTAANLMVKKGFIPTQFGGEHYDIPNPSWRSIMRDLGGEDAIEADCNMEDKEGIFKVTHKQSGITVKSNGAVHAFADLWLQLHP